MALHDDLLDQAFHLIQREPRKPRQASLRRAVSVAYYTLFHLLTAEGARRFFPAKPRELRPLVQRACNHGDMRNVCAAFASGHRAFIKTGALGLNAPPSYQLLSFPLEAALVDVIEAFLILQAARNDADYNFIKPWNRTNALRRVEDARQALTACSTIRDTQNATVFLTALLLQRHWGR